MRRRSAVWRIGGKSGAGPDEWLDGTGKLEPRIFTVSGQERVALRAVDVEVIGVQRLLRPGAAPHEAGIGDEIVPHRDGAVKIEGIEIVNVAPATGTPGDIAGDDVALRHGGLVLQNGFQPRITGGVGRLVGVQRPEGVEEGGVFAVEIVGGPAEPAGVEVHGGRALDKEIVGDGVVAAAAEFHRAAGTVKHVAVDGIAAGKIVEVDRGDAVQAGALQVVPVVIADDIALPGEIAAGVDRAGIAGFGADAVDLVVLQDMIVAALIHALEGRVVDEIVRDMLADALEEYPILAGAQPLTVVVDMVVENLVVRRRERGAIAPGDVNGAEGEVMEITADDAVPLAGGDDEGLAAEFAEGGAGDLTLLPPCDHDPAAPTMLESEALEGNVGDLVEGDKRRGEFGDNDRVRRQRGGGIEINATGFAVEIPLAVGRAQTAAGSPRLQ